MSDAVQTNVGHITWHELMAADKARQLSFYRELFGWEFEQFKPGELDYPMIKRGDQFHGGMLQVEEAGAPTHWLAYVEVADADATAERVRAGGGNVIVEPRSMPDVGRFTAFADPQGAVIAAIQPDSEGPLARGVFVWDEVLTSDLEGAKRFYSDIFGWTVEDVQMEGGPQYTLFKVGDESIAGAMAKPEEWLATVWQSYIYADDVAGTIERARSLGATVVMEPMTLGGVGDFAVFTDPLGCVIGLFKPDAR